MSEVFCKQCGCGFQKDQFCADTGCYCHRDIRIIPPTEQIAALESQLAEARAENERMREELQIFCLLDVAWTQYTGVSTPEEAQALHKALQSERKKLRDQVAVLRQALEPFAAWHGRAVTVLKTGGIEVLGIEERRLMQHLANATSALAGSVNVNAGSRDAAPEAMERLTELATDTPTAPCSTTESPESESA